MFTKLSTYYIVALAGFAIVTATTATTATTEINNNNDRSEDLNSKVQIELYYMPQCPGCRQLITTSFSDAFNTPGFSDMADVTFVSYGNVRATKGSLRIFDNVIESCALDKIDHQDVQFQYIECIDHSDSTKDASKVDMECAHIIGLFQDTIREIEICAATAEGHVLAHNMVLKSDAVSPAISYYPWVHVNGIHEFDAENEVWKSLFQYVCKSYTGQNKSPHCPGEGEDDLLAEQL
jgi:hypothetical protein